MLRLLRLLVIAGIGLVVVWATLVGLVLLAGASPELRRADAIVVAGAAQYNGRPSPVLKARLDHALHLYGLGLAPVLVLTGGVGEGDTLSEGEVARRYVQGQGVPDSAVLVDRWGLTSAESMQTAARLMREEGLESALLVSDAFHVLRLEVLARRAGLKAYRAPAPGSPITLWSKQHWRYVLRESLLLPVALALGPRDPTTTTRIRGGDRI